MELSSVVSIKIWLMVLLAKTIQGVILTQENRGDPSNCHSPLGMQSPSLVPDSQIVITSGTGSGRLDAPDAWVTAFSGELNETLTVDLGNEYIVTGIETQGDPSDRYWVTFMSVQYSKDCQVFEDVQNADGSRKVFTANFDQNTAVTTLFHDVFRAKCIRILPISTRYNTTIGLRADVLGCGMYEAVVKVNPVPPGQEIDTYSTPFPLVFAINSPNQETSLVQEEAACREQPIQVPETSTGDDYTTQKVNRFNGRKLGHGDASNWWTPKIYNESWLTVKFPAEKIITEFRIRDDSRGFRRLRGFTMEVSRNCIRYFSVMDDNTNSSKVFRTWRRGRGNPAIYQLPEPTRAHCVKLIPRPLMHRGLSVSIEFTGCGTGGGILGSCGRRKHDEEHFQRRRKKRVVGGVPTEQGEWPWMVSLMWQDIGHRCGGSLIHPQWVLTAAHCVSRNDTSSGSDMTDPVLWKARVGEHNFELEQGVYADFDVERIIPHPEFNWKTLFNDVSLFKLNTSVELSDYVNLICLPGEDETLTEGDQCQVAGWGYMQYMYGDYTDIANHVDVTVVDTKRCDVLYDESFQSHLNITEEMMVCAHGTEGGKDSCQGDSGGPLICHKDDRWTQFGVTSFGQGCGDKDFPGVYSRVRRHMEWINSEIEANT